MADRNGMLVDFLITPSCTQSKEKPPGMASSSLTSVSSSKYRQSLEPMMPMKIFSVCVSTTYERFESQGIGM